jgi:hypothetical protein
MIGRVALMLLLAGSAAVAAQSPQACPWLNAGTAAKALGGEVAVTAHADSNWSGSCRFTAQTDPRNTIEIAVGKTGSHPCGSKGSNVVGIGNEATLCSVRGAEDQVVQILAGRVRDAWFVVRMTMPASASGDSETGAEGADSSEIGFLAEQVAGNLY